MIITGGFNVYSAEVEKAILKHKSVQDCAVVGVSHKKWGEAVVAVIQLKQGESIGEEEIITFCKELISNLLEWEYIFIGEKAVISEEAVLEGVFVGKFLSKK